MNTKKGLGIFGKLFLYTLLLLTLTVFTLALFFGTQVTMIINTAKINQLYGENDSALYSAEIVEPEGITDAKSIVPAKTLSELQDEYIYKTIIALIIILTAGTLGAAIFARSIALPVKRLAAATAQMSRLEIVSSPSPRRDEIGQLAVDVYKMYESLKFEIEREKEMEENQRYFFSAVSHELKTPIAAASTILEGMAANVIKPSEYPEYLKKCLAMMNNQSKLISEILEIIRLDDNKIAPEYEAVNLLCVIRSVLHSYQMLADAKEQIINVSIPDGLTCTLDRNMFSRAFSNIIMNAVQNTPEQNEIRIWSEVKDNKSVRLCVLNTNAHIDEHSLPKLYEPFYRADKARSRNQNRSGLGLTIVKKSLDCMKIPFTLENDGDDVAFWMDLTSYK